MRAYSSGVKPCCWTSSGVIAGSVICSHKFKVQNPRTIFSAAAIRLKKTNCGIFRSKSTVNSVTVVVTNLNLVANQPLMAFAFRIILDEGNGRFYGWKLARHSVQGQDSYRLDSPGDSAFEPRNEVLKLSAV